MTKVGLETRSTDAKGRVSLSKAFANATVIIEQVNENELRIRKAQVIPVDEIRFAEETAIVLSDRDREVFLQALDHSSESNAALRQLMAGKFPNANGPPIAPKDDRRPDSHSSLDPLLWFLDHSRPGGHNDLGPRGNDHAPRRDDDTGLDRRQHDDLCGRGLDDLYVLNQRQLINDGGHTERALSEIDRTYLGGFVGDRSLQHDRPVRSNRELESGAHHLLVVGETLGDTAKDVPFLGGNLAANDRVLDTSTDVLSGVVDGLTGTLDRPLGLTGSGQCGGHE